MTEQRLIRTRTLNQDDFGRFAALSGDDNPIHVDPAFAARTRFGRTVSHGVLLVSLLHGLTCELRPGRRLVAQGIRFPAPTFADEPMRFEAWTEPSNPNRVQLRVSREADGVVTCDGVFELEAA